MKTISLDEYIRIFENSTKIAETIKLGTQCVAQAKHYSSNVLGCNLSVFGGSAKSGFENKRNTFIPEKWEKIEYKKGLIPPRGAIIFWGSYRKTPKTIFEKYGHVATVISADENKIKVFEQNMGNGNGVGYDDRAKKGTHNYGNCLGWMIFKENIDYKKLYENSIQRIKQLEAYLSKNRKQKNILYATMNDILSHGMTAVEDVKTLDKGFLA